MKKRGFTLIELVVVIALIAILAVTLAPRLRDQLAKARDSKAIALLGSLRTASEIYFAEQGTPLGVNTAVVATADLTELRKGLDNSAKTLLDESDVTNGVPIGGGRTAADPDIVIYGGGVPFTFVSPNSITGDGVAIWFDQSNAVAGKVGSTSAVTQDTKGTNWSSY